MKFNTPNGWELLELRIQVHSKIDKKLIYTPPVCICFPPDSIIDQVLCDSAYRTAPLIYLQADIFARFPGIYQKLDYLISTGLLYIYQTFYRSTHVYQIFLHLLIIYYLNYARFLTVLLNTVSSILFIITV